MVVPVPRRSRGSDYRGGTSAWVSRCAATIPALSVAVTLLVCPLPPASSASGRLAIVPSTALSVTAYAEPATGTLPLNVYFQANATGGTGLDYVIVWTFGDGSSGTGASVRHIYETSGNFSVRVQVSDSGGDQASTTVHVDILAAAPTGGDGSGSTPIGWEPWALAFGIGVGAGAALIAGVTRVWSRREDDESATTVPTVVDPPGAPIPSGDDTPAAAPVAADAPLPRRRASEEVLVHLGRWGPIRDDRIAEPERTQAGIGAAVHLPQNVVSPVLRRLAAAGILEVRLRHVSGRSRRVKVYGVTRQGMYLVADLRHRRTGAEREPTDPRAVSGSQSEGPAREEPDGTAR